MHHLATPRGAAPNAQAVASRSGTAKPGHGAHGERATAHGGAAAPQPWALGVCLPVLFRCLCLAQLPLHFGCPTTDLPDWVSCRTFALLCFVFHSDVPRPPWGFLGCRLGHCCTCSTAHVANSDVVTKGLWRIYNRRVSHNSLA